MKPNVAFMAGGLDACALYREFMPHLHIPNSVFLYHVYGLEPDKFAHCQVAVVQRLASVQNLKAMEIFKKMGMKIVYDLDDDMWSVPVYNPAFKVMKGWLPGFRICAVNADMITVSTQHLRVAVKNELGKQCPPVEVVENAIDFNWFRPVAEPYRRNKQGRVVLGWAGTDTHTGDTKKVFDLIPDLMHELPQLEFEIAGVKLPEQFMAEDIRDRVRQRDFIPVSEFAAQWSSWQWDLSIAPVEQNSFNLSKSNIKCLEAAALGIPCIMSNVGEYAKFALKMEDSVAVLASTIKDWREKIKRLVLDEPYRWRLGWEMRATALMHYDVRKRVEEWQAIFQQVVA
jgi:glycosyltransferase involved in cell wall biosynthesis